MWAMDRQNAGASAVNDADPICIEMREGMHIVFEASHTIDTRQLIALAWAGSAMLEGKPARCVGVLPGLTLHLHTQLDMMGIVTHASRALSLALAHLEAWTDHPYPAPLLRLPLPLTYAVVTASDIDQHMPPALLIERWYAWESRTVNVSANNPRSRS